MFERATLVHPGLVDGKLDVGRILESMLYYSHIDVLVDGRMFPALWHQLGAAGLSDLLTHPSLNAQITTEIPAIINNTRQGIKTHAPIFISSAGRDGRVFKPERDAVRSLHQMINNREPTSLTAVGKIVSRFPITSYTKILAKAPTRGDLFEALIRDSETMRVFLRAWARAQRYSINEDALCMLQVDVIGTPDGFLIANNIDLNLIVADAPQIAGWDEVLPLVHDYSYDLRLSQARSADVITNEANSYIASQLIDMSIVRATQSDEAKSSFEEFAFDEARPFREAFNAGQLSLAEALKIIDQTTKFRAWLNGLPPGTDVITEYHRAVSRDTILGKLPGKSVRFAAFTGGGIALDILATGGVGTIVGTGLAALDSFVLDGLLRGWRPNHFVDTVQNALRKGNRQP